MPSTKRTSEAAGKIDCAAIGLSHWTATCGTVEIAMAADRELPTTELVIRDGQAVWRVCGQGLCVEDPSGTRAAAEFEALCRSRGLEPPACGPSLPCRGPSEVDEPGV